MKTAILLAALLVSSPAFAGYPCVPNLPTLKTGGGFDKPSYYDSYATAAMRRIQPKVAPTYRPPPKPLLIINPYVK